MAKSRKTSSEKPHTGEISRTTSAQLGARIRQAADIIGGSSELADLIGVPRRTMADYVSGNTEPKASVLGRIATLTGTDLNWLIKGQSSLWPEHPLPKENLSISEARSMLPLYDLQASAGAGALVSSSQADDYLSVGRDWLRRNLPPWAPTNAAVGVLEGSGDSMEPTVRDGDLIMVVQGIEMHAVERGGIFVLSLDHDRLLLKRLQLTLDGDLRIISDNKAYDPPEVIPRDQIDDRVIIHGQVFFVGGKPRSI